MMSPSNGPMSSSQKGCAHPPKRKPPLLSSSGPPGAWITLSSDWKIAPVSLRMDGIAPDRRLDPGDVDLPHVHHRFEGALGDRLVGVRRRLQQHPRRDLPGIAPPVL